MKLYYIRHKEGRKNGRKHWWWTLHSGNGQVLATSEMYTRKSSRDKTTRRLRHQLSLPIRTA